MIGWKPLRILLLAASVAALVFVTSIGAQQATRGEIKPANVDATALRNAGTAKDALGGSWLSYGLSQSETRFSGLHQIDTTNVSRLGLSWTYVAGEGGGNQEATPLVWNDTIYAITNWSIVFAVDARTGKERWRWDPVHQKLVWRTPGGGGIGGGTLTTAGNLVFQATNDGRLLAYSADKGEKLLDLAIGRFGAGPPITYLVNGRQYIAMMAGAGRMPTLRGASDVKVANPPLLYVFELDGQVPLPAMTGPAAPPGPPHLPPSPPKDGH